MYKPISGKTVIKSGFTLEAHDEGLFIYFPGDEDGRMISIEEADALHELLSDIMDWVGGKE